MDAAYAAYQRYTTRDEDTRASPFIINARVITDRTFRQNAFTMAERKASQGGAPIWTYLDRKSVV